MYHASPQRVVLRDRGGVIKVLKWRIKVESQDTENAFVAHVLYDGSFPQATSPILFTCSTVYKNEYASLSGPYAL